MFKVKKRNGKVVNFKEDKLSRAIDKGFRDRELKQKYVLIGNIEECVAEVTEKVLKKLSNTYKEGSVLKVEEIQDIVEDTLMTSKYKDVAKCYIKYRQKRALSRGKFFKNQSKFIKTIEGITFVESEENDTKRENANVDGNTAMGTMLQYGSNLSKEFATTYILEEEHFKAHEEGSIHIHDADFIAMGTLTCLTGDTHITIKDSSGKIYNTTIDFFDKVFKNNNNKDTEVVGINNYYILGRNGWTLLKKAMRRKITDKDKLYFLKTKKGLGLKATDKHKIPVIRDGKEVLLETEDIQIGDSLLSNPYIDDIEPNEYINLAEELYNNRDKIKEVDILISNIDKLKKWMLYKYDVTNLSTLIGSTTSRNGTAYITLEQLDMLTKNYYIPYEVMITLNIKVRNSKNSYPILLPITNELAKFFGYLYSEGSIYINENIGAYHISFVNYNTDMIRDYNECATACFIPHITARYSEGKPSGSIIADKLLCYLVSEVIGQKKGSSKISIPDFIFNSSDEIKYSFISAIIDGDGNIDNSGRSIRYTTVSENYAKDLVLLLKSLNIESTISKKESKGTIAKFKDTISTRNYDTYVVVITGKENLSKLLSNLNGMKMSQLLLDYAVTGKSVKTIPEVIVDKIELIEDLYVYDLETAEHWFVANNYIVHNCIQLDLEKLFKRGFNTGHGFLRTPQSIGSYAALSAIAIQSSQNDMHGGQSINAYDYYIAPGVAKTYAKEISEILEVRYNKDEETVESVNRKLKNFIGIKKHLMNEDGKDYIRTVLSAVGIIGSELEKVLELALKRTEKATYQAMESLIHNLNSMNSRAGII